MKDSFDYITPKAHSKEGIYITETLASKLQELYPNTWQSLISDYSFYGQSTRPEHHIFKFKGDLNDITDDDHRYIEIPFSEAYKVDPESESADLGSQEWLAILATKMTSNVHSVWSLLYSQTDV